MKPITRRHFLAGGGATVASQLLTSTSAQQPSDWIELVASQFPSRFFSGAIQSSLWGYNGQTPGPTLRARQGETVKIRFRNELPEPTSIHWHGIRLQNEMDGVSGLTQDPVRPGATFEYVFQPPDAGTFWYHAHHESWKQVARGLYGALVVEESRPPFALENDLTLILDDWRLDDQGRFDQSSLGDMTDWSHEGRLGNHLTVNGRRRPRFSVQSGSWVRLRFINASNARILQIDPNSFGGWIIARDGQALRKAEAVPYSPYPLAPGERVDFMTRQDRLGIVELREVSGRPYTFAQLNVAAGDRPSLSPPKLPRAELPEPDVQTALKVELVMEGGAMGRLRGLIFDEREQTEEDLMANGQVWGFNGVANLSERPLFSTLRDKSIVVTIHNKTNFIHAMHLHGHHFRVLDTLTNDRQSWRDTTLIGPDDTVRIAFVADNPGTWLLHCHMLEHAAAGMTTWFGVRNA